MNQLLPRLRSRLFGLLFFLCTAVLAHGIEITDDRIPGSAFSELATDGTMLVTVGDGFAHLSADNGITWETVTVDPGVELNSVVWHDGKYYAFGILLETEVDAVALESLDGRTWTRTHVFRNAEVMGSASSSEGVFANLFIRHPVAYQILGLRDGKWVVLDSEKTYLEHDGERYLALSDTTSAWVETASLLSDSIEWTEIPRSSGARSVQVREDGNWFLKGSYVEMRIGEEQTLALSLPRNLLPDGASLSNRSWLGGFHVSDTAITVASPLQNGSISLVHYNRETEEWQTPYSPSHSGEALAMQDVNDHLYVTGPDCFMRSPDGIEWTNLRLKPDQTEAWQPLDLEAYKGKIYALYATAQPPARGAWERELEIRVSEDGLSWTPLRRFDTAYETDAVLFATETTVGIVDGSTLHVTENADDWTTQAIPSEEIAHASPVSLGIAASNGTLIRMWEDPVGTVPSSWISVKMPHTDSWTAQAYLNHAKVQVLVVQEQQLVPECWVVLQTETSSRFIHVPNLRAREARICSLENGRIVALIQGNGFDDHLLRMSCAIYIDPETLEETHRRAYGAELGVSRAQAHGNSILLPNAVIDASGELYRWSDSRRGTGPTLVDNNLLMTMDSGEGLLIEPTPEPGTLDRVQGGWVLWRMGREPYFGWIYPYSTDHFLHFQHGWLYHAGGNWFYDRQLGWFFTKPSVYPDMYLAGNGTIPAQWVRFGGGQSPLRWFYVYGQDWTLESEL